MESIHQEDFINSSQDQEVDLPEQGIGRSYECVFCKRGFNTAQALGGHMNIHRKDRARNKPASVNSNKHEENYPRFYQQIPSYQPQYYVASHHEAQFNYTAYFPASASPARPIFANNQQRFNPFGVDHWNMSLNLPCGSARVEDIGKSRRCGNQEEELDLELRLGP